MAKKVKARKRSKAKGPNMLFPGLPNYHGPNRGWFAWVHHGKLFENTDNDGNSIAKRVSYVRRMKPRDERRIRLNHIMYLGSYLNRKLTARRHVLNSTIGGGRVDDDATSQVMVHRYIEKHKPRNRWNRNRGTLVKADGTSMTG